MVILASEDGGTAREAVMFSFQGDLVISITKKNLERLLFSAADGTGYTEVLVDSYFVITTGQISKIGIQIKDGKFVLTAFGEMGRRYWLTFNLSEFLNGLFPSGGPYRELRNKLLP